MISTDKNKPSAEKNANKPVDVGIGSGWGGDLAISPAWGDFGVSQSQEDEENTDYWCTTSDNLELLGWALTGADLLTAGSTSGLKLALQGFGYGFPVGTAVTADLACSPSSSANTLINLAIMAGATAFGFSGLGAGFVFAKELILGTEVWSQWYRPEYSWRSGYTEDWASYTRDFSACNTQWDGYHTLGDMIVGFAGLFYGHNSGYPYTWDDGDSRFGYGRYDISEPDTLQPVTQILENKTSPSLDQKLLWVRNALDTSPNSQYSAIMLEVFESEFADIMRSEPDIAETLENYPLIAHATLLNYLAEQELLSDTIISAMEMRLTELGVPDPMTTFIEPIINNTERFQNAGRCN